MHNETTDFRRRMDLFDPERNLVGEGSYFYGKQVKSEGDGRGGRQQDYMKKRWLKSERAYFDLDTAKAKPGEMKFCRSCPPDCVPVILPQHKLTRKLVDQVGSVFHRMSPGVLTHLS